MDERLSPWPEVERAWSGIPRDADRGGAVFADLVLAERELLSALSGAAAPAEVMKEVTERMAELTAVLMPHQARERDRFDGVRVDLPGRGMACLPPFVIDLDEPQHAAGRVTFSRFYLGGNGAVHGGALPLLFDDVLGHVANQSSGGATPARTAYLTINYRKVTPIGAELTWDARIERVEGRKRFAVGTLRNGDGDLLAESDALFIELQPWQP